MFIFEPLNILNEDYELLILNLNSCENMQQVETLIEYLMSVFSCII